MSELGRSIERERQLGVERHLRRERAVVVEHGDAIHLGHERVELAICYRGDEVDDRLFRRRVTPARESVFRHGTPFAYENRTSGAASSPPEPRTGSDIFRRPRALPGVPTGLPR